MTAWPTKLNILGLAVGDAVRLPELLRRKSLAKQDSYYGAYPSSIHRGATHWTQFDRYPGT